MATMEDTYPPASSKACAEITCSDLPEGIVEAAGVRQVQSACIRGGHFAGDSTVKSKCSMATVIVMQAQFVKLGRRKTLYYHDCCARLISSTMQLGA